MDTKLIIAAAGFGSRMVPVTLTTPKPLVKVNGVSFIETIIDSFKAKGIKENNIYIIRGYKKECFDSLLEKYPLINFVDNDEYNKGNNILSIEKVLDLLGNCYICESDLFITNPNIIPNKSKTSYLARKIDETDDWCFDLDSTNKLINYRKGGKDCYVACGLSYWTKEDGLRLKKDTIEALKDKANRDIFWEFVPFKVYIEHYHIEPSPYEEDDIVEIDSFDELCALDKSYLDKK